jgi:polyphosphate kinase 2 (PPK2 family)
MSHAKQVETDGQAVEKLGRKRYNKELARLQGELVRLQEWVVREGLKVCIVFEGRDTAGKGGVIKRITERVSPRVFRVVALPKPRRIESRINDPRKAWKLSPMDLKSYSRWYEYSRARDEMFAATDTGFAPWHVADSNDKKRARLNIISHLLEQIPYGSPPREPVVLPAREKRRGYREPDHTDLYIQAKY